MKFRKQIMWAINFRNMRTAVHGMYYGKDKRRVQKFAREMDRLNEVEGEYDPEEIDHVWDDFFAEYPDIQMIEEFNYRDIVDLPGGYEGVEIGDTIYKFVNRTSIDLYYESTRKPKMKFKKIVKEGEEQGNTSSDAPAVYVGTYGKYADGSLKGQWVKLTDFNDYDEFMDYIRELHKDESDPEFMFQDYENFPERWYSESGLSEETFEKIMEWYMMDDEQRKAFEAYLDADIGEDSIEDFEEHYRGHYNSPLDFAYELVEETGLPDNMDYYFDYEAFGRDLTMDWHEGDPDNEDYEGNPEDPDMYYNNDGEVQCEVMSDSEVAEEWVDGMGGVDQLGPETIDNYFDYEQFARELFMDDFTWENGYVFWSH